MSTFTAIGPALNLDGPLPQIRPRRLLDVPGVVQQVDDDHIFNGVNVWGYPDEVPSLWEPCSTGTYRIKDDTSTMELPRFDSFVAYVPIECSTISMGDPDEFAHRAELVLEATLSYAIEEALAKGVSGSTNPFFGDTNLVQLGGGVVTVEAGIAYLENAIGQTGRGGILHLTPGVVGNVGFNLIRVCDPDGIDVSGDEYLQTANGTPVSAGAGYIDTDPAGKTGSDPSTGKEWCFATGPVYVYLSDMTLVPTGVREAVDRSDNVVTYRAERTALAIWDTALQDGVLIDWTCGTSPCAG